MTRLAVDLLGADTDERELCRGAIRALKQNEDLFLSLCGHRDAIEQVLTREGAPRERLEVIDSPVALTNSDDPMQGYTTTDASMVKAMTLVRDGKAAGIVTCGATGCVLVSSIMLIGKLRGLRPILAVELRNEQGGPLLLLDCGANIDSRPDLYPCFAKLGDAYMRCIGKAEPRISLLSNGAEDEKGCEAVKEANRLLRSLPIGFLGNIEPTEALSGKTDVIVCDGFHGNLLLKSVEGVAKTVIRQLTARIQSPNAETKQALEQIYRDYDFNARGGAILLGVKAPVMKGHGAANGDAVTAMLARMTDLVANGFIDRVRTACV